MTTINGSLSERDVRIAKVQQLRDLGINPYVQKFNKKHMISDLIKQGESSGSLRSIDDILLTPKQDYQTAGRLVLKRVSGKLSFAKIMDESGEIQIMFEHQATKIAINSKQQAGSFGLESSNSAKSFDCRFVDKMIDIGDFIGVRGELFMTHKGELTLFVSEYQLLSKAIRPLGDKFHGIGDDQEKAYRQRYLDMIFNRETLERMKLRSMFIKTLRDFYHSEGFIELETPILTNAASGAAARPFTTHHHDFDQDMYLRISLECPQKVATVGMLEKVFEIGKEFRNEGSDPSHIQEFTGCEHYAVYWNYEDNMRFTEQMFDYLFAHIPQLSKKVQVADKTGAIKEVDFQTPWQRIDYIAQVQKDSGIDVSQYGADDEEKLRAEIKKQGHNREGLDIQTTATMIDYLYKKVTRPKIVGPAFIINYPKTMQPLARQSDSNPNIVEQRQLLINGRECIKAYGELVDPQVQQANFDEQAGAIARGDDEATKSDDEFVTAMEYGMPPQSGRGMGIDRIFSLLTEQANIRDVVLFPLMKPENPSNSLIESNIPKEEIMQQTNSINNMTSPSLHADHHFVSSANSLSEKYLTDTLLHCQQVAHLMKFFAHKLGKSEEEASYRYIVGLLHDIDRDHINKDAARHLQNDLERMIDELSIPDTEKEQIVVDIRSHGPELSGITPSTEIQKYLISIDELSGLMYAYARMRDGFIDMEVSGVMKRIKDKKFAAGVDRDHVKNCEKYLGISLETFISHMIEGFQSFSC